MVETRPDLASLKLRADEDHETHNLPATFWLSVRDRSKLSAETLRVPTGGRRIENRSITTWNQLTIQALKRRFLEKEKQKWLAVTESKHIEYCMVGAYVIDEKLKKLS